MRHTGVVTTLRADFYDRPLLYPQPGELVRLRTEVVLPLTGSELERAIVRPAARVWAKGIAPDSARGSLGCCRIFPKNIERSYSIKCFHLCQRVAGSQLVSC